MYLDSFENKNTTFEGGNLKQPEFSEENGIEENFNSLSTRANEVVASVSDAINSLTGIEGKRIDFEMSQLNEAKTMEVASIFGDVLDNSIEASMAGIDEFSINESASLAQLFGNSMDSEYNSEQFVA